LDSWKTLSRRMILDHSIYLKVENHVVELEDGQVINNWPWVIARDFVNVIPVTAEGKIILFRQGKYGFQGVSLAPIGGYLEPGETPLQTARRELLEEAGYQAEEMIPLAQTLVSPNMGFSTGNPFLARGLTYLGKQPSDDLEAQEILQITPEELEQALLAGLVRVTSWYASFANVLLWLKHHQAGRG